MTARTSGAAVWGSKLGAVVVPAASATPTASINMTNTLRMGVFFFLDATPPKLSAHLVHFKAAAMLVLEFFADELLRLAFVMEEGRPNDRSMAQPSYGALVS